MLLILGLFIALGVIVVDQISKYVVMHYILSEYAALIVTPFFAVVRAWNTGVSFSMFNNFGIRGVYILSGIALIIVALLLKWLKSEKNRSVQVALGFIIGGALGNVIDRIHLGAVFDFLDFYIGDHHWPAFNIADSFICIGAGLIVFHSIFFAKKREK
ncbi:MAG: signal peptidase II [Alphaproteobacteria bacterium]|nr:signal peptidase II [Alphaproteobacteria bacterium]